jgi:hypothetical protein
MDADQVWQRLATATHSWIRCFSALVIIIIIIIITQSNAMVFAPW